MSIIKKVDGVPVFSNIQRALLWGKAHGLEGYHDHMVDNQKGYMGGLDHSAATNALDSSQTIVPPTPIEIQPIVPAEIQPPIVDDALETQPPTETQVIPRQTGGGSGGGGGY
tara:strand:+ start:911 stop:1246 length:336 start_codon:yes stop_codon:yes gene_type:complete